MNKLVGVVDYGLGNLFSVCQALVHCGAQAQIVSEPSQLDTYPLLVLPGVGAFPDAMSELRGRGMADALVAFARSGRPVLGICLGFQLLFDVSEEFGEHSGLGLIPGRVSPVPETGSDGKRHKIPHVGWAQLFPSRKRWDSPLFSGIAVGESAYFVHSYAARLYPEERCISSLTDYDGVSIVAAVEIGNVYGCQFHPEKSGKVGLRILSNFISLSKD
jgi:glutamine amidotransferase